MSTDLGQIDKARSDFRQLRLKLLDPLQRAADILDAAVVALAATTTAEASLAALQPQIAEAEAGLASLRERMGVARAAAEAERVAIDEALVAFRHASQEETTLLSARLDELRAKRQQAAVDLATAREETRVGTEVGRLAAERDHADRVGRLAAEEHVALERLNAVKAELAQLQERVRSLVAP